ncbi:MAG: hypothetical protein V4719_17140 [Planctomycetota bacterium]
MSVLSGILILLVVAVGLVIIIGCAYWVMTGATAAGGNFRNKAPNLRCCPQCGAPLDAGLDHCPQCSLRISV